MGICFLIVMIRVIKQYGISILLLIVAIFCLFNIGQNIQDVFTVITNSLAIFLAIFYFVNFEKNIIIKIKSFVLNIKWPFHGKTKKILTNVLNFIIEKRWEIISYLFLLLLLIITLGNFTYLEKFIDLSWVKKYQAVLTILTIVCGGLIFWHNRERIEKETEEEQNKEELSEQKRKEEFSNKFPKINKVPVLRNLAKWMYKEGWGYSLGLIILILLMLFTYIPKLGYQYLWSDEFFSFHASEMILEHGKPIYQESGLNYTRAPIYHNLNAKFMGFFGVNEFGSRIINIFFNFFFIFLIYFSLNKYNKKIAIFSILLFLTTNFTLGIARETRMYSMFAFLFFLSAICFYNFILNNKKLKHKFLIFKTRFDFNYYWLILFIISFYISYETQTLSLIFILSIPIIFFILFLKYQNKKKYILLFFTSAFFVLIGIYYKTGTLNLHTALIEQQTLPWVNIDNYNNSYYIDLIKNNFPFYYLTLPLTIIIFLTKKSKYFDFLFIIFVVGLYFLSKQYTQQERYIYFLFPLCAILSSIVVFETKKVFKNLHLKRIFILIIILLLASQINLFITETRELASYEKNSIFKHKKLNFNEAINYLESRKDNYILITDFHATFTLYSNGYKSDLILLKKDNYKLERGKKDVYLNIKFLEENSKEYDKFFEENSNIIIISRDTNIYKYAEKINETKPFIFIKR